MGKDENAGQPVVSGGIYIGIGANLTAVGYAGPKEACMAALDQLPQHEIKIVSLSPWYRSAPVPVSDQPWFYNAVAEIDTELDADATLAMLHRIEAGFGRVRNRRNEARVLDMDLLDYRGTIRDDNVQLPHPRMHSRGFVLYPLRDIAARWRHPQTGASVDQLIAAHETDATLADGLYREEKL